MGNRLLKLFTRKNRVPTILPLSYPGIQLLDYNIKETLLDAEKQYNVMKALSEEFELDLMFNFMELSVEPGTLGATVVFEEYNKPSVRVHPVKTLEDIENIKMPDPKIDERMATFIKSMKLISDDLSMPILAAVSGPFTLAGEMMNVTSAIKAVIKDKDFLKKLLDVATEVLDIYVKAFTEAGADIILICEPTASMLSPVQFREFSGDYIKKLFKNNPEVLPTLHICGNTKHLLDEMVATGAIGLSFDAVMDMPKTAEALPKDIAIIGNIDPSRVLNSKGPEFVKNSVLKLKESMKKYPNFILMPGCDLPHTVSLENIHAFIEGSKN